MLARNLRTSVRTFLSATSSTCLRLEGREGREGEKEKGREGGEEKGREGGEGKGEWGGERVERSLWKGG